MSKHLGLIKEYQPIETSHAYEKLNSTNNSNEKEKLFQIRLKNSILKVALDQM